MELIVYTSAATALTLMSLFNDNILCTRTMTNSKTVALTVPHVREEVTSALANTFAAVRLILCMTQYDSTLEYNQY